MLFGDLVDQSALYGLLEKLHKLNLTLLSVQQVNVDRDDQQNPGDPQ